MNCVSSLGSGSATTHAFHFKHVIKLIGVIELVLCLPNVYKQILGFIYLPLCLSLLFIMQGKTPKERYVLVWTEK